MEGFQFRLKVSVRGFLRLTYGILRVTRCLTCSKDVDTSCGNILRFPTDVIDQHGSGSVRPGGVRLLSAALVSVSVLRQVEHFDVAEAESSSSGDDEECTPQLAGREAFFL